MGILQKQLFSPPKNNKALPSILWLTLYTLLTVVLCAVLTILSQSPLFYIVLVSPLFLVNPCSPRWIPKAMIGVFAAGASWLCLIQSLPGLAVLVFIILFGSLGWTLEALRRRSEQKIAAWTNLKTIPLQQRTEELERALRKSEEYTQQLAKREAAKQERTQRALRESETRFRSLFNQSPNGILIFDPGGRVQEINQAGLEIMGVTEPTDLRNYVLFDDPNIHSEAKERLRRGEFVRFETEYSFDLIQKQGSYPTFNIGSYFLEISFSPLQINNQGSGFMAHLADTTDRRRSQQAEHEMRVLAEALRDVASALNSTLLLDEVLDLILARIAEIQPYDALTVMLIEGGEAHIERQRGFTGDGNGDFLPDWHADVFDVQILRQVIESGSWVIHPDTRYQPGWFGFAPQAEWVRSVIYVPLRSRNEVIGLLTVYSATPGFFTAARAHHVQAFADQAASAIANARLYNEIQDLATHDELTKLYNRRALFDLGRHEIDRCRRFKRPLSLLFIDVDHFKRFNDRYSYAIGDRVLRFIAGQIQSSLRDVDVVTRYGGEEFIALLTECDLPEAIEVAERLRARIESCLVHTEMGDLGVTVSIGVAKIRLSAGMTGLLTGSDQKTLEELIQRGNQALHEAKRGGRNRVEVAPDVPKQDPETSSH